VILSYVLLGRVEYLLRILEQIKSLDDIFETVLLTHLHDHDFQELLEINPRGVKLLVALPQIPDQFDDLLRGGVETQCSEDDLYVYI
jgi:hypothetical protein